MLITKMNGCILALLAGALLASDPPLPSASSISVSRRNAVIQDQRSPFDEGTLRIDALMEDKDLSPFIDYTNETRSEQFLALAAMENDEQVEVFAFNSGSATVMTPKDQDVFLLAPGATVHFASQVKLGHAFHNACLIVLEPDCSMVGLGLWFQHLPSGKPRSERLQGTDLKAVKGAFTAWCQSHGVEAAKDGSHSKPASSGL